MSRLLGLPFIVLLMGIGALAMLAPAVHAYIARDLETARDFFYSSILALAFFSMIAIATSNYRIRRQARSHLISMLGFFTGLPLLLAVPFSEAVPDTTFLNAYVEMVSSLTTTGFTLFEADRLPPSVHLWRALAGWLGGFFVWVTAVAVLAPLNLGGFEVASSQEVGQGATGSTVQIDRVADASERLWRFSVQFFPVYGGLTAVLWIALMLAGDAPLVAICHAMSTLATSGITPGAATSGFAGEAIVFVFLIFALSRVTFSPEAQSRRVSSLVEDPELRLGLAIIAALPVLLFLRHWVAVFDEDTVVTLREGMIGLWGAVFTIASFLTTTGFESAGWESARAWSGLEAPGVLLVGLALFGGGVATTAGGVKLLRVYALYKHGLREMEKLVQPSSIGGAGQVARRFRRQGAFYAWVFFMLFAISIALVSTLFAASGVSFEDAMVLTIAALSTTGPLAQVATADPISLGNLNDAAKAVLTAAMILGRLETLAIIALLNPEFWR
ncbi:MAG: potassium transporter TrkG [Paracoccaceae bacterium]|nr:potassium transporter TrkG [Paracoccaceae bacterium]